MKNSVILDKKGGKKEEKKKINKSNGIFLYFRLKRKNVFLKNEVPNFVLQTKIQHLVIIPRSSYRGAPLKAVLPYSHFKDGQPEPKAQLMRSSLRFIGRLTGKTPNRTIYYI